MYYVYFKFFPTEGPTLGLRRDEESGLLSQRTFHSISFLEFQNANVVGPVIPTVTCGTDREGKKANPSIVYLASRM